MIDTNLVQLLSLFISTAGAVALAWIAYKQAILAKEQKVHGARRDRKLDQLDETCREQNVVLDETKELVKQVVKEQKP